MGRGRGRGRGTYCRSHTIVTPQWSRHLHPALHPPAPLRSVYDHLSFLAQPCGGQGPHDQCPCDTCPHGIGTGVQGLPPACHNIDIDRDPDHLCKTHNLARGQRWQSNYHQMLMLSPCWVCTNGHKDGASVIFEYNWRMSGDPNTHELRLSSFNSWHSAVLLPC